MEALEAAFLAKVVILLISGEPTLFFQCLLKSWVHIGRYWFFIVLLGFITFSMVFVSRT